MPRALRHRAVHVWQSAGTQFLHVQRPHTASVRPCICRRRLCCVLRSRALCEPRDTRHATSACVRGPARCWAAAGGTWSARWCCTVLCVSLSVNAVRGPRRPSGPAPHNGRTVLTYCKVKILRPRPDPGPTAATLQRLTGTFRHAVCCCYRLINVPIKRL